MSSKKTSPFGLEIGSTLKDTQGVEWSLGKLIAQGGFGCVHAAKRLDQSKKEKEVVIKIEPAQNLTIMNEISFCRHTATEDNVREWKRNAEKSHLGILNVVSIGEHEHCGNDFKFLVLPRLEIDLWQLFCLNDKDLPINFSYNVAIQIVSLKMSPLICFLRWFCYREPKIDALDFIHSHGFVHNDVKPSNILLHKTADVDAPFPFQAFLCDFGLLSYISGKYVANSGESLGTLDYMSLDNHLGIRTRRGDIESLLYLLQHITSSSLPWFNLPKQQVIEAKKKFLNGLDSAARKNSLPQNLINVMKYCRNLKFDEAPEYTYIQHILTKHSEELRPKCYSKSQPQSDSKPESFGRGKRNKKVPKHFDDFVCS